MFYIILLNVVNDTKTYSNNEYVIQDFKFTYSGYGVVLMEKKAVNNTNIDLSFSSNFYIDYNSSNSNNTIRFEFFLN